jgi:hypothetical protein
MDVQRIAAFSHRTNGAILLASCSAKRSLLPTRCWRSRQRSDIQRRCSPHRARTAGGCATSHQRSRCRSAVTRRSRSVLRSLLPTATAPFTLQLNDTWITVTRSEQAPRELVEAALGLFSYTVADLDPRPPPAIAEAGARHLVLAQTSRQRLAAMHYDLERGRRFMMAAGIVTISLVQAETNTLFHARNPFARREASTRTPRREPRRRPSQDICGILDGLMVG